MKYLLGLMFLLASAGAAMAQGGTVANHAVAIGKGPGVTGLGAAVPSTAGLPLVSSGASADPVFGNSALLPGSLSIGTTATASGGGIFSNLTNPTICGQGVSFGSPLTPCTTIFQTTNGLFHNVTVNGSAAFATAGALFNFIVNNGYSAVTGTPVGFNVEMQVNDTTLVGNDVWNVFAVLDIQTSSIAGGQASSAVVRGNWTGTMGFLAGFRAQAENYTGRPGIGLIVSSSQTDGVGAAFDNAWNMGIFIHQSHSIGLQIGGFEGPVAGILPTTPIIVQDNAGSNLFVVDNFGTVTSSNGAGHYQFIATGTLGTANTYGMAVTNFGDFSFDDITAGAQRFTIRHTSGRVDFNGLVNSVSGYLSNGVAGVDCSGVTAATVTVAKGIVTHC